MEMVSDFIINLSVDLTFVGCYRPFGILLWNLWRHHRFIKISRPESNQSSLINFMKSWQRRALYVFRLFSSSFCVDQCSIQSSLPVFKFNYHFALPYVVWGKYQNRADKIQILLVLTFQGLLSIYLLSMLLRVQNNGVFFRCVYGFSQPLCTIYSGICIPNLSFLCFEIFGPSQKTEELAIIYR